MNKKNVIWLVSYPKSGNTWFRVFLANLLSDTDKPVNINELQEATIASSRKVFDEYTGISSSELTFDEIDQMRPHVYRMQSSDSDVILYKKVHDTYSILPNGLPLFPSDISKGALYFIRNPLDVLVSFAYHSARKPEEMLKAMNNPNYSFCGTKEKLFNQLRQKLSTWSGHVESWTEQDEIPIEVIRYEDMKTDTLKTFKKALQFIELDIDDERINKAIKYSDISILKEQEVRDGFREKMQKSKSFFRKGEIGDYKNHLTNDEVNQIISNHNEIMKKYGYLDNNGKLLY